MQMECVSKVHSLGVALQALIKDLIAFDNHAFKMDQCVEHFVDGLSRVLECRA